jgi:ABC-type multidrug transport system ATPase subunit
MIEIQNIYLKSSGKDILHDITISFMRNKLTLINGHNGAGKTSLIKIVANIIAPTSGIVEFKNKSDIVKTSFSFQEPKFLVRSVEDNLLHTLYCYNKYFSNDYKCLIKNSLDQFNLLSIINRPAHQLSAGEKKVLSYIRSTIVNPTILFLDEPLAYLDDSYVDILLSHIKNLSQKTKVIMVNHSNTFIDDYATDIITLNRGRLI